MPLPLYHLISDIPPRQSRFTEQASEKIQVNSIQNQQACMRNLMTLEETARHGTAGPQVQGHSASYRANYAQGFSAGLNPKRGDSAEN
jgi:hypothetical protein